LAATALYPAKEGAAVDRTARLWTVASQAVGGMPDQLLPVAGSAGVIFGRLPRPGSDIPKAHCPEFAINRRHRTPRRISGPTA